MTVLSLLLLFKIGFTLVTCSLPLLLLSASRITTLYGIGIDAAPLCRLYGVAITALLVGYAAGVEPAMNGEFPTGVITMGIVSNAGATATLVITGSWQRARFLTLVFGGIAAALTLSMLFPAAALGRVF